MMSAEEKKGRAQMSKLNRKAVVLHMVKVLNMALRNGINETHEDWKRFQAFEWTRTQ